MFWLALVDYMARTGNEWDRGVIVKPHSLRPDCADMSLSNSTFPVESVGSMTSLLPTRVVLKLAWSMQNYYGSETELF